MYHMQSSQVDCPNAVNRLLEMFIPELIKGSDENAGEVAVAGGGKGSALHHQHGSVKLEQRAVDEV